MHNHPAGPYVIHVSAVDFDVVDWGWVEAGSPGFDGCQAGGGAEGFVGLQGVSSDKGLAVFAPERMVAGAADGFARTGDGQRDRAGGLMQKGARDDSASAGRNLGARINGQHMSVAVDAALGDGDEHRAADFAVLLIQPRERPEQHDLRHRPVPLRSPQCQFSPFGGNDLRTERGVFFIGG